jgi:hypothetical protein
VANTTPGKIEGKTPEIKNDIFDNTGPHDAANFHRSLKNIANYLQLMHRNDVSEAIRNLTPITITLPPLPPTVDPGTGQLLPVFEIETYLWKEEHKKASTKKDKYEENMNKAYIIIFHQCTTSLKNDLEAANKFPAICTAQGPIGLLKLIQSLCCSYNSKTQSVMATVASHKRLFTYYQRDGVDNNTYYMEFMAHVETIETYGGVGAVGVIPSFLAQKVKELVDTNLVMDVNSPTNAERITAIKLVRDEFLDALMLSGMNKDLFSALKTELSNQYGFGNDLYPKSVDQCLIMLNRWVDAIVHGPQPAATPPVPERPTRLKMRLLSLLKGRTRNLSLFPRTKVLPRVLPPPPTPPLLPLPSIMVGGPTCLITTPPSGGPLW